MIRVLRIEINCRMKRTFLVTPGKSVAGVFLFEDCLWFCMLGLPHLTGLRVSKKGFTSSLFLLLGVGIILVNI